MDNSMLEVIKKDFKDDFRNYICRNKVRLNSEHYRLCIIHSSFNCLEWIHFKIKSKRLVAYIVDYTDSEYKCIKMLKWYSYNRYYKCAQDFGHVIRKDYLNAFIFMIKNGWKYVTGISNYIFRYNSEKIFNHMRKCKLINIYSSDNCYYACWKGNFNFYKNYVKSMHIYIRTDLDYAACAYNGHIDFFEQLEKDNLKGIMYSSPNCSVPFFAAAGGHLSLLKFSFEHNYHKNKLYFKKINPNIRYISECIFGKEHGSSSFLINYLYKDKLTVICKMRDIAETMNNIDCVNYLDKYLENEKDTENDKNTENDK